MTTTSNQKSPGKQTLRGESSAVVKPAPSTALPVEGDFRERFWQHGLLVLCCVGWGLNYVLLKFLYPELGPIPFLVLRNLLVALAILGLLYGSGRKISFERSDRWAVVLIGGVMMGVGELFFFLGLDRTTADNAALLSASAPVFAALAATTLGMEQVSRRAWVGIFISFVGIYLIIAQGPHLLEFKAETLPGDLMVLCSTIGWGCRTVLLRPLIIKYGSEVMVGVGMIMASVVALLWGMDDMMAQDFTAVSTSAWLIFAYVTLLPSLGGFIFWNWAVGRLGANRTIIFSYFQPVFTIVFAYFLLDEMVTVWQGLGGVIVLGGVIFSRTR